MNIVNFETFLYFFKKIPSSTEKRDQDNLNIAEAIRKTACQFMDDRFWPKLCQITELLDNPGGFHIRFQ